MPELFALLHKKNPDSPYDYNDNSRRNEFVNNRALFDKKAQYFTKKYSTTFTKFKEFPNVYLFSSISCPELEYTFLDFILLLVHKLLNDLEQN